MNKFSAEITRRLSLSLRKFARNRRSTLAQRIDGWAVEFHRQFENWNYRFASNGEARVLECLRADSEMKMIFDAGANHGAWSLLAAEKFPQASIHAFELSPPVAGKLQANVGSEPRIVANAAGLSDLAGEIEFFYAPNFDTLSSAVVVTGSTATEKMRGRVLRGTDYCREKGIGRIDFLKMDVEGMEDRVLRGFDELLEKRAIRVMQFEYGRVNIESHFLLKDFYSLLTSYGFVIGKIYPDEVLFKDYAYTDEDFLGPNYLAVLQSETALIERLA